MPRPPLPTRLLRAFRDRSSNASADRIPHARNLEQVERLLDRAPVFLGNENSVAAFSWRDMGQQYIAGSRPSSESEELLQLHASRLREQRLPEVTELPQSRRHVVHAEVLDRDAALELLPRHRRRNGRSRLRAHG